MLDAVMQEIDKFYDYVNVIVKKLRGECSCPIDCANHEGFGAIACFGCFRRASIKDNYNPKKKNEGNEDC